MSIIRWEDPPAYYSGATKARKPRRANEWRNAARLMQERPGDWALVDEGEQFTEVGGLANQIRKGRLAAFRPAGHFEAATRVVAGSHRVYARYVGEAGSEATPNDFGEPGTPTGGGAS